jgi:hypothetical protein
MAVVSKSRVVARRSGFDAAMAEVKKTEQETDYEFALGRASAYLELGQDGRFSREQRLSALRAARATAEEVAVWSRADLLVSAGKGFAKLDAEKDARESLEAATSLGRSCPPPPWSAPACSRARRRPGSSRGMPPGRAIS